VQLFRKLILYVGLSIQYTFKLMLFYHQNLEREKILINQNLKCPMSPNLTGKNVKIVRSDVIIEIRTSVPLLYVVNLWWLFHLVYLWKEKKNLYLYMYGLWYQNLCEHTFLNIKYTHHSCSFLTRCTPFLTLTRVRISGEKEYNSNQTVFLKYILNRSDHYIVQHFFIFKGYIVQHNQTKY